MEVGWEVCWQLGGIYTVLRTKAQAMVNEWKERYCLVGPYNAASAEIEFEPMARTGHFGAACDLLERERGVKVHFGRWLVSGEPQVVLLDFSQYRARLDHYKFLMWKDHGIEVGNESEVEDSTLFGYLAADYLEMLHRVKAMKLDSSPLLAQFHEWMAGVPIPILLKRNIPISTVFTTHATILGRYLAAGDPNFYQNLTRFDPFVEAKKRNIFAKYSIERAATWGATCFTTISEITGIEAEHLLGRKADVLLPNGLNSKRFAAVHEFQNLHLIYKKRIQEFVMGHFFPSYTFDLGKTLHIFTAGRYEHQNKGLDLFIESLARLNWRLKSQKKDVTVIAFIVTRAPTRGFNVHTLKNQMLFREMANQCETIASGVSAKLLFTASMGVDPKNASLFEDRELHALKRLTHAWRQTHPLPNVVTHNLEDEGKDPILNQLRQCGLVNRIEDPVKVVYHPEFMTSASPIIGLDYEQFVRGCHLGVFPSYYEPWGYTPEECAALGIPSITSDLSGFGSYVREKIQKHEEKGLFVIDRRHRTFDESADQLTDTIFKVMTMSMRERIELRNRVESESAKFDWKELIPAYRRAHRIALARGRHHRTRPPRRNPPISPQMRPK
ncbi:MAG: glycogen synthase [Methylotenera sp.]|nr:glycogen synthase [Oligoflexia bacterium]